MWSARIALPRFAFPALLLLLVSGGSASVWSSTAPHTGAVIETAHIVEIHAGIPEMTSTPVALPVAERQAPAPQATPTPFIPALEPRIEPVVPPVAQPIAPDPAPTPESLTERAPSPAIPRWSVVSPVPPSPSSIMIPSIGVDARVTPIATTETGAMEAPEVYSEVGWYRLGVAPGEVGRAVLAGHVDSRSGPAVFYRLRDLKPGDVIEISVGVDRHTLRFVVRESARYPEDGAPLDQIFGASDRPELVLITCDGAFDRSRGSYDHRLVVFADLLDT